MLVTRVFNLFHETKMLAYLIMSVLTNEHLYNVVDIHLFQKCVFVLSTYFIQVVYSIAKVAIAYADALNYVVEYFSWIKTSPQNRLGEKV